jgi:uncharacterized protein (TIGR04255 family)
VTISASVLMGQVSMGEKMKNPPIFFTAGQLRFNPILEMADSVKAIQHQFRREGFADFAQDDVKSVQVVNVGPMPQMNMVQLARWRFGNAKRDSEFVLFTDKLVFQTTAYDTSATFTDALLAGIQIIHSELQVNYVDAVSMRTLDAVIPEGQKSLQAYLHPQLLGFYGTAKGDLKHSILEGVCSLDTSTQLISRVAILSGSLGLPLDLMPMALAVNPRFNRTQGVHAILDNDCIEQDRFEFDIGTIRSKFRKVKSNITDAFYSAVTEEALEQWK